MFAFFGGRGVRFLRGARRFFRGARGGCPGFLGTCPHTVGLLFIIYGGCFLFSFLVVGIDISHSLW